MRFVILTIGIILSVGCNLGERRSNGNITIGDYHFTLPSNYTVEERKSFNAEMGSIETDSFTLQYEYSNHTEPPVLTPQEYIERGLWQAGVARELFNKGLKDVYRIQFLSTRPSTDKDSMTHKGCDYIATCRYDSLVIDAPIYLPKETKESRFMIDTFGNHYRKLFFAHNPQEGRTGVYIKQLPLEAIQTSAINALVITANNLTQSQQDNLLKAFLSIKAVTAK